MQVTLASILLIASLAAAACATAGPPPAADDPLAPVRIVDQRADAAWPGLDVRTFPIALYDGAKTFLIRHPSPPEGFRPDGERPGIFVYEGRHPAVTANSTATIGGALTATVMPAREGLSLPLRAGLVAHEIFHAYQQKNHPQWTANEAELFTYPFDDATALALRRVETEALRRALAGRDAEAACWARTALEARRARFERLPASSAAYEVATELNEGLPTYVEHRIAGTPDRAVIETARYEPEAVRSRAYVTGHALARLLDRFAPSWKTTLQDVPAARLDRLLESSLPAARADERCSLSSAERAAIEDEAARDVAALGARRAALREEFLGRSGWRIVVETGAEPLFPRGFDPLNVQVTRPGEVLHTRFLNLAREGASVEVLGRPALTQAAGDHPLFNGVRTVTIAGLEEPAIASEGDDVVVRAEGVTVRMRGAALERTGSTIFLRR